MAPTSFRGPLESALRHPILAVLPVLALAGSAVAVGLTRDPVYTAEARISVGRIDVPAYTLQGVIIGNATLATSYARAIDAPVVTRTAAQAAGVPPEQARASLNASQIPNSTLIRVEATGREPRVAETLANGAARGLVAYVTDLNVRQQDPGVLARYRRAQALTDQARLRYYGLRARLGAADDQVRDARLLLLTRQLRSQSLSTRVVQRLVGGTIATPPSNLLQILVPAQDAESDASSVLTRLVLFGVAAGVVIGLALALLRANAALVRRRRD